MSGKAPNPPACKPDSGNKGPTAAIRFPFVRRSRLARAERQFAGACRELARVERIRAEAEITLQWIASHPHGGLLSNIARVKLERLGDDHG